MTWHHDTRQRHDKTKCHRDLKTTGPQNEMAPWYTFGTMRPTINTECNLQNNFVIGFPNSICLTSCSNADSILLVSPRCLRPGLDKTHRVYDCFFNEVLRSCFLTSLWVTVVLSMFFLTILTFTAAEQWVCVQCLWHQWVWVYYLWQKWVFIYCWT